MDWMGGGLEELKAICGPAVSQSLSSVDYDEKHAAGRCLKDTKRKIGLTKVPPLKNRYTFVISLLASPPQEICQTCQVKTVQEFSINFKLWGLCLCPWTASLRVDSLARSSGVS